MSIVTTLGALAGAFFNGWTAAKVGRKTKRGGWEDLAAILAILVTRGLHK